MILAFQMPLLFFISGYSTGFSYPAKNSRTFLKKKIQRLLVPYLVWENIHFVSVGIMPGDYRTLSVLSFVKELFVSDFWFLRYLFVFYLVLWICNILLKRIEIACGKSIHKNLYVIGITLCSPVLIFALGKIPYISESVSMWYYLWFIAGWLGYRIKACGWNVKKQEKLNNKILSVIASTGIVAVLVITYICNLPDKLVALVLVFLIVAFVVGIEQFLSKQIIGFLAQIGSNTLPIYAIHWCLLFSPLWREGLYTSIFGVLPLWLSSIITFSVWTILCLILIKIFESNRFTRRLLLGVGWNK